MPAALAVDWEQIKQAAIAGVPFRELAVQWGLRNENGAPDTTAIRKRCSRESWPIASAIRQRLARRLAETKAAQNQSLRQPEASQQGEPQNGSVTVSPGSPKEAVLASLEAISARHPLRMASFLERKLARAIDRDTIQDPQNWKELQTADTMLRRSLGLDKPSAEVKVNLAMFQGLGQAGQAGSWEVEPVTDETQE